MSHSEWTHQGREQEALIDCVIDGYLSPDELSEIVSEAIKLTNQSGTNLLRSYKYSSFPFISVPLRTANMRNMATNPRTP